MPRLAANLSTLFTEHKFLDRFAAAADAGFEAVELQFPYAHSEREIARRLKRLGLAQVLINAPPGDLAAGDRGLAVDPGRRDAFASALDTAMRYAATLRCPHLHVMAGVLPPGADRRRAEDTFVENLKLAAETARAHGVTVLIEPLNPLDVPGYFLTSLAAAKRIIGRVGRENVCLQLDLYHCAMRGEDIVQAIETCLPLARHIQIADAPGRHEPGTGVVDYSPLLALIDSLGYEGFVGCEYHPRAGTLAGLGWAKVYGIGAATS